MNLPILVLIFNRPDNTLSLLNRLREIKPTQIYIGADGPRLDKPGELQQCQKARAIFEQIDWNCEIHTLYRKENLGCRLAVAGAIDWFFEQVEYGVILEDDCIPHLDFFAFCKQMLIQYQHQKEVKHIGGFNCFHTPSRGDYFFTQHALVWGWATWRDRWQAFDLDMKQLPHFIQNKRTVPLFNNQLAQTYIFEKWWATYHKENSSWAYAWAFEVFAKNEVCILPKYNLITNIGFDAAATHTAKKPSYLEAATAKRLDFPMKPPYSKNEQTTLVSLVSDAVDKKIFHAVQKSKFLLWFNHLTPKPLVKILKKILGKK